MSTTVSGAAGSDKANESRGAVAKTKDPAPSPTAPSSAPRRIAAKAKPDMPPKVQSLLIGIVIVMLAYLIGIYNPTNIRFVEPRHSRTSYVPPCCHVLLFVADLTVFLQISLSFAPSDAMWTRGR